MKTPARITPLHLLVATIVAVAFVVVPLPTWSSGQSAPATDELVQRGAYLARAGDCLACHIAQQGKPFAGGLPFDVKVGTVYSTNITPDRETGIGLYSRDDFVKVMRKGVAKDGRRLYSAMPYPSFAKVSPEDLAALYAYFMQGVTPVRAPARRAHLSWPLGSRSLLAVWNALYFKKGEYAADPRQSDSWNRGAYLVQGLGHCGACHTPRGIAGQEKAGSERDGANYLAGAALDDWYATSLRGEAVTGLAAWSQDELVESLRSGRTARVAATGMMADVVAKSTQYLTDPDLMAIAEYLKSLPADDQDVKGSGDSRLQADADHAATRALKTGETGMRGSRIYLDNCCACHHSDGAGAQRIFPNLVRNESVNTKDPVSLIHLLLAGSAMPSTQTAPSAIAMPDFGWRLSDEDLADVLSFIRASWGNHAPAVKSEQVARVRKSLAKNERTLLRRDINGGSR